VGRVSRLPLGVEPDAFRDRLRRLAKRQRFVFPSAAIPESFRRSAVLIAFWQEADDVRVLLTRRATRMSRNAGQIAFPGGLVEGDEGWDEAALREAEEEVGLAPDRVQRMGRLDDAWSGTGSHLVSLVGWLESRPVLEPNPAEVSEILTPTVGQLLAPGAIREETIVKDGVRYLNHVAEWPEARAFGLSADLLIEAVAWGVGREVERGPSRLADLAKRRGSLAR
jgi:8-oxo-dGTP pyrophosphatase MutT (NUDIX family)